MEQGQPRFMECAHCGTIHIVVPHIVDPRPTCKKCGSLDFIPRVKGIPGYMPEFCDHRKDKEIWNSVVTVMAGPIYNWIKQVETKYQIKISREDVSELLHSVSVVGKSMVNTSRNSFIRDTFIRHLQSTFRSFVHSKYKPRKQV